MTDEENGAAAQDNAATGTTSNGTPPKKKRRNNWIVLGVVAAVIVAVVIGFDIWHNQPSFCNTVCHSPMDNYVESYSSGDPGMMVTPHEQAGYSCLDCHEARIGQQIGEVGMWIDDTYKVDANGDLVIEDSESLASPENCLKSGCHDWNEVVDSTWGFEGNDAKYNPHSSHQDGSITCSDCHKSHSTSELYCAKCHSLNLPEGWEATSE